LRRSRKSSRCSALAAAAAAALLIAAPAAAAPPADWAPGVAAATAYAKARAGLISFHVRTERGRWSYDADRAVPSASVVKAMLLAAYLNEPGVRDRPLSRADRRLLGRMIIQSSNRAATRVRDLVGNDALTRVAARAGMTSFAVHAIWGLSRITARDQTRLWLHFERSVPARHRTTAMRLLASIVERQRWGIARVALPPGWTLYFKGGWGSGRGLVDHQVALLRRGEERVAIAILTDSSPSHRYGKRTLRGLAERLLAGLP